MVVDTEEQYNEFLTKFELEDCILVPVLSDIKLHPKENSLSLLYAKFFDGEDYILPFNHSEAINLTEDHLQKLTNSNNKKYTYDKKRLLHIANFKNVYDINLLYYMDTNHPFDIYEVDTNAHRYFTTKFYHKKNLNKVIPILKHLEYCRKLVKLLEPYCNKNVDSDIMTYNNDVIESLTYMESSGLQRNKSVVYSEYNPYTSTGRPSNRFGGINFAALNKNDGSRKSFVSRFGNRGVLVEYDFDGYHLRLIADLVGYELPEGSIHQYLAEQYGVDYNESKALSFKFLYGGIPKEISDSIPFFNEVKKYINKIWKEYKREEFIVSDIYKKRIYKKNLRNMNKNKVFNYLVQLLETESNMKMLTRLIPQLESYDSKLVLYSYDSFLFDFCLNDGLEFLKKVKDVIERHDKFPTKVSWGPNYHEMKDITGRFI